MKISPLLSLILISTCSIQAGYFESITKNNHIISTPQLIPFIPVGLGIFHIGSCVKDLWKVGNILYDGDEAIAKRMQKRVIKHRKNPENSPATNQNLDGLISILAPRENMCSDTKFNSSVGKIWKPEFLEPINQANKKAKPHFQDLAYKYQRDSLIAYNKEQLYIRALGAALDITLAASFSYAGYVLINKIIN
jgi:hypothetical protein